MRVVPWRCVIAIVVAATTGACTGGDAASKAAAGAPSIPGMTATRAPSGTEPAPSAAATRFLQRYVTTDGRVIRHDQGGDIVSEGQALGMLIAELAGRGDTVRSIWAWTAEHLARSDSLLAYHATGAGTILDHQPAADADTLAAFALLRYRGTDEDRLHADGRRLASAVLDAESVSIDGDVPVVVAGLWAKQAQAIVNPSYWMPSVYRALAALTSDHRWSASAEASVRLINEATGSAATLPPDWARLSSGRLAPIAAPSGSAGVQYGLDAERLPVWLSDCSGTATRLAARWWDKFLSSPERSSAMALSLQGEVIDATSHPLPLIAAAAAAQAAGDASQASGLMDRAKAQSSRTPTYYGDAWLALGEALLDRSLVAC